MVLYGKFYPADRFGWTLEDYADPYGCARVEDDGFTFGDMSDADLADFTRALEETGADLVGFCIEHHDASWTPRETLEMFCEEYR